MRQKTSINLKMARDVPFSCKQENVFCHTSFLWARDVSCHKEEMCDQSKRVPHVRFQTCLKHVRIWVFYSVLFPSSEKKEYFTAFSAKKEYFTAFSAEKKEYFTAFSIGEEKNISLLFPPEKEEYFTAFSSGEERVFHCFFHRRRRSISLLFTSEKKRVFHCFFHRRRKSTLSCLFWLKTLFYLEIFLL